ncbi:MAG: short-chain dehydrogenase [Deltaproteobacteria bacterium]|nr:short-chain dehydrogenase [Deltaproteobacteria bacterium]
MELHGKRVMVLGGAGLVGQAICRHLIDEEVAELMIASLVEEDAIDSIAQLHAQFPDTACRLTPLGGDIFAPLDLKDLPRTERLADPVHRARLTDLLLHPMRESILTQATLYQWCMEYRPEIILDCVNSATALAYSDVYSAAQQLRSAVDEQQSFDLLEGMSERLCLALGIPQLIRHIQILWQSMLEAKTDFYLKIGTSGTGGLGITIPYTHSEGRDSQLLLSKAAIAGAHSLLLFLLARTPGGPIVKELKPTAYIGWKKIGFGPIVYRGKPFYLEDCPPEAALPVRKGAMARAGSLTPRYLTDDTGQPRPLEAPYIDTGENGMWSHHEFALVTDHSQMEFITPEEIAQVAVWEIQGRNTGHDIIAALDISTMGPTYRAGYMRGKALAQLRQLEEETGIESITFETGGPTVAKYLYEAYLLSRVFPNCEEMLQATPEQISEKTSALITTDVTLRSRIISIGIPILMPDGQRLLRGQTIHIPSKSHLSGAQSAEEADLEEWAAEGWVDLRATNWTRWMARAQRILEQLQRSDPRDTSSYNAQGDRYWEVDAEGHHPILISKFVSWIFRTEQQGERMKD